MKQAVWEAAELADLASNKLHEFAMLEGIGLGSVGLSGCQTGPTLREIGKCDGLGGVPLPGN